MESVCSTCISMYSDMHAKSYANFIKNMIMSKEEKAKREEKKIKQAARKAEKQKNALKVLCESEEEDFEEIDALERKCDE